MLLALPAAAWLAIFLALPLGGQRIRILASTTIWAALAIAAVEILSPFRAILPVPLSLFWASISLAALASRRSIPPRPRFRLDPFAAAAAGISLLVAVTSLSSPPNTADAITYHAPRVFFWAQHASLAHYPTQQLTQLLLAPGAELLSLHFQVLLGNDSLMPFPQLMLFLHAVIAASVIAGYLGAGPRIQSVAALLTAAIPEGVLQASGAKNDFVAAGWLLIAAGFLLAYRESPGWRFALLAGTSAGLAVLTKSTILPWLPAAACIAWRLARPTHLIAAAALAVALNTPQTLRYHEFTGKYFGETPEMPGGPCKFQNQRITPGTFSSNAIRNVALHLSTPWETVNKWSEQTAIRMIRAAGEDPNDPATTWCGQTFSIPPFAFDEIRASNTLHLLLLAVALPIALHRRGSIRVASLTLLSAAALFCLLLQWQPWHTRLHILFFAFGAPLIAVALPPRFAQGAAALAALTAMPYVFDNQTRPLLGARSVLTTPRDSIQYFGRMMHAQPFERAFPILRSSGCDRFGLANHLDNYHYPLMMRLKREIPTAEFQYVDTGNSSTRFPSPMRPPCAVICLGCGGKPDLWPRFTPIAKGASEFEHLVTFTSNVPETPRAPFQCRLEFDSAWYPPESGPDGTWRWSDQGGRIQLQSSAQAAIKLHGNFLSLVRPNTVELFWNGKLASRIVLVPGGRDEFSVPVDALAGQNELSVRSTGSPVTPANDARRLGIGIAALQATDPTGALACR